MESNLAFLCLDHHHQHDSKSRQAKGLTASELRVYKDKLAQTFVPRTPPEAPESSGARETEYEGEVRQFNAFICKRNETELRENFDFPSMLKFNIALAKCGLAPNLFSREASAAIDLFFLNGQAASILASRKWAS